MGIVAAGVLVVALIASTMSWCDFSVQAYRVSAPVPLLLCPGGASAGEVPEGETVRVTSVYSGSLGEFSEVSAGNDVTGWADAAEIDAATGVTTSDIFGLPVVTDPAFDGPDCTSTAPTTVETTDTTAVVETTVATTEAVTTTPTTVAPTTAPRPTVRPTRTTPPTVATTATTLPTTTSTTRDTDGPDVGPVRLRPSTLAEPVVGSAVCSATPTIAQLTVSVSDPSGVNSVSYEARVKGLTEKGILSNVDELYSGTVGPFTGAFSPNEGGTSAVIAVVITATDNAGNVTVGTGSGTLLRCTPPQTPTTTIPSTTTTFVIP